MDNVTVPICIKCGVGMDMTFGIAIVLFPGSWPKRAVHSSIHTCGCCGVQVAVHNGDCFEMTEEVYGMALRGRAKIIEVTK